MTTDEQVLQSFAKVLLAALLGSAGLFVAVGCVLSMLLH